MKTILVFAGIIALSLAQRRPQQFQPAPVEQYDEPQQYQAATQPRAQPQPQQQYQPERHERRETTTYIPIIRFDKEQGNDGSYRAAWETGNNIIAEEEGHLKNLGPDPDNKDEILQAQVQQGSYSYTAPDGQVISVHYTADETGFHPNGDHLPTPPPVSPEVQKGLDLIYAGIRAQQEQQERAGPREVQQEQYNQQEQRGQYRQ